jgi:hypothetical protein
MTKVQFFFLIFLLWTRIRKIIESGFITLFFVYISYLI